MIHRSLSLHFHRGLQSMTATRARQSRLSLSFFPRQANLSLIGYYFSLVSCTLSLPRFCLGATTLSLAFFPPLPHDELNSSLIRLIRESSLNHSASLSMNHLRGFKYCTSTTLQCWLLDLKAALTAKPLSGIVLFYCHLRRSSRTSGEIKWTNKWRRLSKNTIRLRKQNTRVQAMSDKQ